MKKLLSFSFIATLLLTLAACGTSAPIPNPPLVLGEKYLADLDYEQALLQFDQAISVEPKNPRSYLGKADALLHLDRSDEAVSALADGATATSGDTRDAFNAAQTEIKKSLVDGYIGLSSAYEKMGWREIAIILLHRVCEELPEESRLREAFERLTGVSEKATYSDQHDDVEDNANIIPASMTGDDSDWIVLAQNGDYFLILRSTCIGESEFGSDENYANSSARQAINMWFNNLPVYCGLRQHAVPNNIMDNLGNWGGVNDNFGLSSPRQQTPDPQNPVPDIAFLLSFQEAFLYCSLGGYDPPSQGWKDSDLEAVANWNALSDRNNTDWWFRSPGGSSGYACLILADGGVGYIDGPIAFSLGLRPALWVESTILN